MSTVLKGKHNKVD